MNRPQVLLIESMYDKAGEDLLAAHTDVSVVSAASRSSPALSYIDSINST